ncbi:ApeI family dehydratase [Vibrio hippocampi]|uniref:ApeI dehydratase-like domain-containing protein n=1 Tax=Vibrio hippocampi TaxID=654686 RepID=A0ABN8DIZ0_9VIBR|nr:3-hydroxyacyl-ACP dehydratase [Vibrio hippocampi]CAH0529175.1 hypothetical protein VHP8226_03088 [Vibrio hippocampi]
MDKRKPTLIRHTVQDNHAELELRVDGDILYFQGHFDQFKLLPGVAQVDWAVFYARQYLNTPSAFKGMEVIKFQEPILPDAEVTLSLTWDEDKQKLAFKYTSMDGERLAVHASGKMKLAQPDAEE